MDRETQFNWQATVHNLTILNQEFDFTIVLNFHAFKHTIILLNKSNEKHFWDALIRLGHATGFIFEHKISAVPLHVH